jgi:peroxiredoxin
MNRVIVSTVLALAATVSLAGARPASPPSPLTTRPELLDPVGASTDYAVVGVGSQAPDFSFDAQGRSLRLRDLRANGHVLLVFTADDARLAALERERVNLLAIGVVPVAVLDQRAGSCAATTRRLGLGYSVIPDPRRVIGAQFNALDPSSRADAPAWFVLDRSGRVRALAHLSWPEQPWTDVTAHALGLSGPDATAPASFGRH